jgi:hypothetical protein
MTFSGRSVQRLASLPISLVIPFPSHPRHSAHKLSPPAALSRCIRATYCLLTVFHALMYFSMQLLKQPSSPLDRLVPGLGTQRSKQCSLSFWMLVRMCVEG